MLVLCAVALAVIWTNLGRVATPANTIGTIVFLLLSSIVYLVSLYWTLRISPGSRHKQALPLILAAAIVFRLTVWSVFPFTSEDPYRYRWEGRLQAAGGNPYQSAPNDPAWAGLRDEAFAGVVGKDFRAVYGPFLQLVEHATYQILEPLVPNPMRQVFWFKAPAALADLGVIAALIWWLRRRGSPVEHAIAYAWCPLPIWEFWATGHNDAFLLLFLVLTLATANRGSGLSSFAAIALAAATKLWPAMLIPRLWNSTGRKWTILAVLPVWAALAIPYVSDVSRNAQFVSGFLGGWRNNDSLYGLILEATGNVYTAKYLAFGFLAIAVAWASFARIKMEAGMLAMIIAMLAVSANVHPWYLTWIVPFLAIDPSPALLLWVSLAPMGYFTLIRYFALGEWDGVTPWRWAVYVPVAAISICELVRMGLKRRSSNGDA